MKADDEANERIAALLQELFGNPVDGPHIHYVFVAVDDRVKVRQVITDLEPMDAIEFLKANVRVMVDGERAKRPPAGAN